MHMLKIAVRSVEGCCTATNHSPYFQLTEGHYTLSTETVPVLLKERCLIIVHLHIQTSHSPPVTNDIA